MQENNPEMFLTKLVANTKFLRGVQHFKNPHCGPATQTFDKTSSAGQIERPTHQNILVLIMRVLFV